MWPCPFHDPPTTHPHHNPLSFHRSLPVTSALVAFKCLTYACTILIGLVLSWKVVNKRDPHSFGFQLLGQIEQWGLWNTSEGNPGQSSSAASTVTCLFIEGPYEKGEVRLGEETPSPCTGHQNVVVHAWVGKEFPDMKQIEQRIKLIRVGDTVRTVDWFKGELNLFTG